ncbi:hypothetical protein AX769_14510 [Frondihabitans sp. PAMC 28766]|uniref:hypothetical protein n=1 Tax=Frondihabitans sp. PAMC 28766 TaxID=1795630 RepID=UPI00078CD9C1|nr:hypothetical protein [Frondihabitans sp. PAMC 28766]AMM21128.1 hypothetical protein AX769_14510 [Frondihabitans sp. PAMC 28766]
MSTTLLPPVAPPSPPEHFDAEAAAGVVPAEVAEYRRRLRRRLMIFSAPVVVVVILVALKLLSMPILAGTAQATYDDHAYDRSIATSDGLSIANVFEPWVQHFDRGTALAQIGVLTDARPELERALTLVPNDDVQASCRVRTDLVLVVEQQGDGAVLDQAYTKAETFYAHALALEKAAPTGCFTDPVTNDAPSTKKPLDDARNRLEQKQKQAQQDAGGDQQGNTGSGGQQQGGQSGQSGPGGQGSSGSGSGSGQGSSGQGSSGSGSGSGQSQGSSGSGSDPLQQLQQQDQQAQTEQQQNDDRQRYFKQNPEDYGGKPW